MDIFSNPNISFNENSYQVYLRAYFQCFSDPLLCTQDCSIKIRRSFSNYLIVMSSNGLPLAPSNMRVLNTEGCYFKSSFLTGI